MNYHCNSLNLFPYEFHLLVWIQKWSVFKSWRGLINFPWDFAGSWSTKDEKKITRKRLQVQAKWMNVERNESTGQSARKVNISWPKPAIGQNSESELRCDWGASSIRLTTLNTEWGFLRFRKRTGENATPWETKAWNRDMQFICSCLSLRLRGERQERVSEWVSKHGSAVDRGRFFFLFSFLFFFCCHFYWDLSVKEQMSEWFSLSVVFCTSFPLYPHSH